MTFEARTAAGDLQDLSWSALQALAQESYERLAGAMLTPAVASWGRAQAARYGDRVQVEAAYRLWLSWPAALAVVRYGGAPHQWPAQFTAADEARAAEWAGGGRPRGVVLQREG